MKRFLPLALLPLLLSPSLANDTFPMIRNTQAAGEHPPSPREMLDLFELPEGFKVTLFAGEPDVQQPIAFDFDDFGRIWVAENYTYSARGKVDQEMRDRVIILHDKDGDGEHDERKVFWDKGRMLTGLTWGYGGLWILNDGTLSFIPDKNGDDIPDSDPIPMLNGWTKNAGHNVVNGLLWGPDGWLYGRHGITDTSYPGTIDTPKEERQPMNCGIWRFHPVKHTFEIVCHGTTNPWGLDYNEVGDMFMSNNVIGHLWHVIPGAHYQRMFGQDFNPHCYELMGPISDHYHWDDTGKWHESRDGKANDLGGGHSHCGLMLYYGQNFPKEYWGKAFMCNTHGRCVNVERIERKGSSYVAKHEPNFLKVNTPWFRGVQLAYGPAGCVYLSDWSDNGECHDHDGVHRTSGRIYRISYGDIKRLRLAAGAQDLADDVLQLSNASLLTVAVEGTRDDSEWAKRRAQRILAERASSHADWPKRAAEAYLSQSDESQVLGAAQILSAAGQLNQTDCFELLDSQTESLRASAITFGLENRFFTGPPPDPRRAFGGNLSESTRLLVRAADDESGLVAQRLASALTRLDERTRVIVAQHLIGSLNRRNDEPLLLLTWYSLMTSDSPAALLFAVSADDVPDSILQFAARRIVQLQGQTDEVLGQLLSEYGPAESDSARAAVLQGMLQGYRGRHRVDAPGKWADFRKRTKKNSSAQLQGLSRQLDLLFGDGAAIAGLRKLVLDRNGDHAARSQAVVALANASDAASLATLLSLLNDRAVYVDICKALAAFDDDPRIPKELLKRWNNLRHGARETATDTLCSRKSYAVEFTKAIADGRVDPGILTAAQVRQLNAFNDDSITAIVDKHWGVINETPEALEASIAKWKQELTDDVLAEADLTNGAALFKKTCATCHKLYGEGGKIGPDLTGGNRANMDYLLGNVINPSAEVPKQYTVSSIALTSGRLVNGVVVAETENTVTVQTDKEQIVIAQPDIDERVRTSKSLMPEGLLDSLTPEQVRDLIAFVRRRR